jgi:DNA/RNA-binding domain of Phe-tRNA-synthetase-like protein
MPLTLLIQNRIPTANPAGGVRLGIVRAEGVNPSIYPSELQRSLSERVALEQGSTVTEGYDEEARRAAARDMLRNGRYKPTGRGKPASEYLVRSASGGEFPRINSIVDVNNLISLEERLPISLWDLDRVGGPAMVFRTGRQGERYVFNVSGQTLDLQDLVVGCSASGDGVGEPAVSPIKDSQLAKTRPETARVAAAIYAPAGSVNEDLLAEICERFAGWLSECGSDVVVRTAVVSPGDEVAV